MELRVEKINKRFGEKTVLDGVSFRVEGGRAMGLLGRNGAGKTTTLRIITDIFRADGGEVLLDGKPVEYGKVKIGYLPEERGLYPKINVGEQMVYIGRLKGLSKAAAKKNAQNMLEELEASEYWGKKLETLSKGNQQKIQLAIAVLHDPDIVILDEPFSGLDPVNARILKDLIVKQVERGKLVLFSSHQMPYVEEFCQHICILNKGVIVLNGRIKDIKKSYTYTRNRVSITPETAPEAYLSLASRADGWAALVKDAVCRDERVEITLHDASQRERLFKLLADCAAGVDTFNVIEPTLEEIFVDANTDGYAANGAKGGVFNE